MKGIGSRFSNSPSLKALFNSLERIKKTSYTEEEKESHENDVELIIKRISIYIKRKLTEDDLKVLETIVEEINSVVGEVSKKIDSEIESMVTRTAEEPKKEKKKKSKTEVKVNERLKNKLRKKIKEIIRTHLFNNR